jgi:hypothetical protein
MDVYMCVHVCVYTSAPACNIAHSMHTMLHAYLALELVSGDAALAHRLALLRARAEVLRAANVQGRADKPRGIPRINHSHEAC